MQKEQEFNLKQHVDNSSKVLKLLAKELDISDEKFKAWKASNRWNEIMEYWLNGKCNKYPVTWEGLDTLLVAVRKKDIAKELKKAIEGWEGEAACYTWHNNYCCRLHLEAKE